MNSNHDLVRYVNLVFLNQIIYVNFNLFKIWEKMFLQKKSNGIFVFYILYGTSNATCFSVTDVRDNTPIITHLILNEYYFLLSCVTTYFYMFLKIIKSSLNILGN